MANTSEIILRNYVTISDHPRISQYMLRLEMYCHANGRQYKPRVTYRLTDSTTHYETVEDLFRHNRKIMSDDIILSGGIESLEGDFRKELSADKFVDKFQLRAKLKKYLGFMEILDENPVSQEPEEKEEPKEKTLKDREVDIMNSIEYSLSQHESFNRLTNTNKLAVINVVSSLMRDLL